MRNENHNRFLKQLRFNEVDFLDGVEEGVESDQKEVGEALNDLKIDPQIEVILSFLFFPNQVCTAPSVTAGACMHGMCSMSPLSWRSFSEYLAQILSSFLFHQVCVGWCLCWTLFIVIFRVLLPNLSISGQTLAAQISPRIHCVSFCTRSQHKTLELANNIHVMCLIWAEVVVWTEAIKTSIKKLLLILQVSGVTQEQVHLLASPLTPNLDLHK